MVHGQELEHSGMQTIGSKNTNEHLRTIIKNMKQFWFHVFLLLSFKKLVKDLKVASLKSKMYFLRINYCGLLGD